MARRPTDHPASQQAPHPGGGLARSRRGAGRHTLVVLLALFLFGCGQDADTDPAGGAERQEADVALNNRGVALMGRFDYAGAYDAFAELVARRPDWLDARTNLAIAAMNRQEAGDEAFALEQLEQVMAQAPDHLRANYVAGVLHLYLGEVPAAAQRFAAVVARDPSDAFAQYYLGRCRALQGDPQGALAAYRLAVEHDPYLRSAYFGLVQVLQRLGRGEEAQEALAAFERLANNPRARLAEFKYTRMGPRSLALAAGLPEPAAEPPAPPAGPLFEAVRAVATLDPVSAEAHLTTVDMDGDGSQELFLAGARGGRLLDPDRNFAEVSGLPWAGVADIEAVAWGDVDNDGRVDVYLCRHGANQLWLQTQPGTWTQVGPDKGVDDGARKCADVAMVDADHDGDLDILIANRGDGDTLLNNDRNGRFRSLADRLGEAAQPADTRRVVMADLDGDRDVDLLFLRERPPHLVLSNDRLWRYAPAPGLDGFAASDVRALAAADLDADGRVELVGVDGGGRVTAWVRDEANAWAPRFLYQANLPEGGPADLAVLDLTGDGRLELLLLGSGFAEAIALTDDLQGSRLLRETFAGGSPIPVLRSPERGPSLVAFGSDPAGAAGDPGRDRLLEWAPGPGRFPFVTLVLSGRHDEAATMRSNASGIGTLVGLRAGSRWTLTDTYKHHSLRGHSLQPLAVGTGGRPRADFVALDWSDGVFQTELDLEAGAVARIAELERQLSSCPVLFAWDGERYAFITDILGVGGMGGFVEPGVVGEPRPWERLLLPPGSVAPKDGRVLFKLAEPMQESAYIDAMTLHRYDLPEGWQVTVDERMATAAPAVTGEALFYRQSITPARAYDSGGRDVLPQIARRDHVAMPPGELDRRFIGLLAGSESLTLEFPQPLDAAGEGVTPVLIADSWVEYPYSQTVFSAWQAGVQYRSASLEARDGKGEWHMLYPEFGYPAGMPREMTLPLRGLPSGTDALRLTWNRELYWDRIRVVLAEPPPPGLRHESAEPRLARIAKTGFAARTTHAQRRPEYDYQGRVPFWDTEYATGFYTRTGNMTELVAAADDALAIIGPGEEIHVEFDAGAPPPAGYRRWYVLEALGWAKDKDLYTRDGETVGPLPRAGGDLVNVTREELHRRYNTRFQTGR